MKRALLVLAVLTVASVARATPKPVVCLAFTETTLPVDGAPQPVAICLDSKRPTVLLRPVFVTTVDKDGASVRIAIGWRQ